MDSNSKCLEFEDTYHSAILNKFYKYWMNKCDNETVVLMIMVINSRIINIEMHCCSHTFFTFCEVISVNLSNKFLRSLLIACSLYLRFWLSFVLSFTFLYFEPLCSVCKVALLSLFFPLWGSCPCLKSW